MVSKVRIASLGPVVGICLLMLASASVQASLLTYSVTGTGSGSIGAQSFTNAQITISGTADTANLQINNPYLYNNILIDSASVDIVGIGTAVLDSTNLFFVGQGSDFFGFYYHSTSTNFLNASVNISGRNVSMTMRHRFGQFSVATQPPVFLQRRRAEG